MTAHPGGTRDEIVDDLLVALTQLVVEHGSPAGGGTRHGQDAELITAEVSRALTTARQRLRATPRLRTVA